MRPIPFGYYWQHVANCGFDLTRLQTARIVAASRVLMIGDPGVALCLELYAMDY
jgi:hypothetical protein